MVTVTGLFVYPVKSLQGIALQSAKLTGLGLEYDRTWMVTDRHGEFLSQRDLPAMASIGVELTDQALVLSHAAAGVLRIPLKRDKFDDTAGRQELQILSSKAGRDNNASAKDSTRQNSEQGETEAKLSSPSAEIDVVVWGDTCMAHDEGLEASEWLTGILGEVDGAPLRLVRFAKESIRPVETDPDGNITSVTAFADGYPYLVASEESLAELNRRLHENGAEPVTMDRFRANIVIKGAGAFAEDRMKELADVHGRYLLGVRKPCKRCKVTTVDQKTGEIPNLKEPLKTLASMNPFPDQPGAYFGQNVILLGGIGSTIRCDDVLTAEFVYRVTSRRSKYSP
jgi:uncharacterized protein